MLVLAVLSPGGVNAGDHSHEEHSHGHDGASFEVGLSNAVVVTLEEGRLAYGLHVHGIYTFEESPFAVGLGYELVVGEHLHQTVGPMVCYRPAAPLNLCFVPGVLFEDEEVTFVAHVETAWEFEVNGLHLGPALGFAYTPEDIHLSLGLHTGYSF